jgi:hypothetical protein
MKKITLTCTVLSVASLAMIACGPSLKVAESTKIDSTSNGGLSDGGGSTPVGVTPTPGTDTARTWSNIKAKTEGAVAGSSYDGQLLIQIDTTNQAFIFYLPIPFASSLVLPVQSFDIPTLPGLTVFQVTNSNGDSQMAVRVPLKYLRKGAALDPYNLLPNGDPLPYMPAGENRGFALSFPENPDMKLHFYLTANAAAVFIEIPALKFPDEWLRFTLGFPMRNQAGTQTVGYLAFVPNKGLANSGVFVSGRIPTEAAVLIDQVLRY